MVLVQLPGCSLSRCFPTRVSSGESFAGLLSPLVQTLTGLLLDTARGTPGASDHTPSNQRVFPGEQGVCGDHEKGPEGRAGPARPGGVCRGCVEGKWQKACLRSAQGGAPDPARQGCSFSPRWAAVGAGGPRCLAGTQVSSLPGLQGHVMDRRKKALTDYRKLRAFFAEEEERFLQEAEKEEGSLEDEDVDPADRFGSLLQVVSELERRHRSLGLSMLLQVGSPEGGWSHPSCLAPARGYTVGMMDLGDPGLHTPSHLRAGLAAPVPPSSGPPGAILILQRLRGCNGHDKALAVGRCVGLGGLAGAGYPLMAWVLAQQLPLSPTSTLPPAVMSSSPCRLQALEAASTLAWPPAAPPSPPSGHAVCSIHEGLHLGAHVGHGPPVPASGSRPCPSAVSLSPSLGVRVPQAVNVLP